MKCIGSYPAKAVTGITLFAHELSRAFHPKENDRIVITSDPRSKTITLSLKSNLAEAKRAYAREVISDLQGFFPNCFRTRKEANKTTTTFWPGGYPTDGKESECYHGSAITHPNDEGVHVIGKAIAYIRAYMAWGKDPECNLSWLEKDLKYLSR